MPHVITAPCHGCKHTDCVVVCPMDCFYEGEQMLYIHPEECTDCGACASECPTEAIFPDEQVPAEWQSFIQLNAEMSALMPNIVNKRSR